MKKLSSVRKLEKGIINNPKEVKTERKKILMNLPVRKRKNKLVQTTNHQ